MNLLKGRPVVVDGDDALSFSGHREGSSSFWRSLSLVPYTLSSVFLHSFLVAPSALFAGPSFSPWPLEVGTPQG